MQKSLFIASMISIGELTKQAGSIGFILDKNDPESKETVISDNAKKIFDLSEKSMASFYKSDNKTAYSKLDYDESLNAFMGKFKVSSTDDLIGVVDSLKSLIEKVSIDKVFHDSGLTWNKTKTDKNRFSQMTKSAELILGAISK